MGAEVLMFTGLFATIFGLYFLRSRENMAMIERGINPRRKQANGPNPYAYMKYALLFAGAGVGLLFAYILDVTWLREFTKWTSDSGRVHYDENPAIYFSLLAIGGGLGLFSAYRIEKKHWKPRGNNETEEKDVIE